MVSCLFLCVPPIITAVTPWQVPFSCAASWTGLMSSSALLFPAAVEVQKMVVAGLARRLLAGIYPVLLQNVASRNVNVTKRNCY
jgi:hypothetical protein